MFHRKAVFGHEWVRGVGIKGRGRGERGDGRTAIKVTCRHHEPVTVKPITDYFMALV